MFSGLRLRLTLLYCLAALLFLVLVGGGSYTLLAIYFRTTTDLALQHKMVHELQRLGEAVPTELVAANQAWYDKRNRPTPPQPTDAHNDEDDERDEDDEDDNEHDEHDEHETAQQTSTTVEQEDALDGELAGIFAIAVDDQGQASLDPGSAEPPLAPDGAALNTARSSGRDLRTVQLPSGTRVRLLTYRLDGNDNLALLQLGRTLGDQERVLNQLFSELLTVGSLSALLVGFGSWWLAGRSIRPAQHAYAQQQTFVANASHELRTPLTLARASAEIALGNIAVHDSDTRALLGDVLHECDHMSQLVDDLLLLSRLDAGRLNLNRTAIDLAALLGDIQRQVSRLAPAATIAISIERAAGQAWADETRLRQVLLILIDNALRHTPAGGRIALAAEQHDRNVTISVTDTGCGIAPEHLAHLFERFYRADSARGTGGGAGLGLALAQALMRAQQGQISIESRSGHGTTATLTLPATDKGR